MALPPAPLSRRPSELCRRGGGAQERGSVYSAVAAPRHRSAHVSPRLGASAVTGTAGVGCSGSKGF